MAVRLAIARHLDRDRPGVGDHALAAAAIAAVAGLAAVQMVAHLGIQRPLGQCLLQRVQQTVGVEHRLRVGASQQFIQHRVRDPRKRRECGT